MPLGLLPRLRTAILLLACLGALSPFSAVEAAQKYILKFATLAPAGSAWMQLLDAWADEVREKSDGIV